MSLDQSYYFAYGSNMNPDRMADRGLQVLEALPGKLAGYGLRFNKRSRRDSKLACANIIYAPKEQVEGVLYRLSCRDEVGKLDSHEGTPRMYSRDIFQVITESCLVPAWVYIANPAVIDNSIKPARWYIEHLLAGKLFISTGYWHQIDQTVCREEVDARW